MDSWVTHEVVGCWLMDHGWMGEAGFWTCPEALEWVVGGGAKLCCGLVFVILGRRSPAKFM